MAESCKEQQVRVEEEVLKPIDGWVKEQRERCENEPCNPWLLCLNKLVCWLVWVTVKGIEWVLIIAVRWVHRTVCVVVSLVLGLLALIFTFNADILVRALLDLWELAKDAVFFTVGFILLYGNSAIDFILTTLDLKDKTRKLNKGEISSLRPIFGDSLSYNSIEVNQGRLGIMGPSSFADTGATTIGYTIYFRTYDIVTLVHECVHIWQFQFGGTHYIGQSAIYQVANVLGGSDPYNWFAMIGTDINAWYLLESVEAQAEFVEDAFRFGRFVVDDDTEDDFKGAFFQERDDGHNQFTYRMDVIAGREIESTVTADGAIDFTNIANAAWAILRTG